MSSQVDKRTGILKHEVHVQRERANLGETDARLTQPKDEVRKDDRTAAPHGGCPSAYIADEVPNVAEANVTGHVETEDDPAATNAWTRTKLGRFDAMARANRQVLRGTILDTRIGISR